MRLGGASPLGLDGWLEVCDIVGEWRAQYYSGGDRDLLVEDDTTFDSDGRFVQVLRPYPTDACEENVVTWVGTYTQTNQTSLFASFIECQADQVGCVKCSPTSNYQIDTKFTVGCKSFTWKSQDILDPERTYFFVGDTNAHGALRPQH